MLQTSFLIFTVILALLLVLVRGLRDVGDLDVIEPKSSSEGPFVSIVVAARNEQKALASSLQSMLALTYPHKEIVVVNDRSTDDTAGILSRLRQEHPEIKGLHVKELPEKWLGKNHAQYIGAKQASGDIFLFTDADILWEPDTLSRAVFYFQNQKLDHLAILPRVVTKNWPLAVVIVGFQFFFNLVTRPWKVKDPRSFAYVGIGAFNMIRRTAYEAIGTHQAIAMRPDDDMQIGLQVKKKKLRSDFLFGVKNLSVEWYESVRDLIAGLMKNSFAGANYRLSIVLLGSVLLAIVFVWPFVAVAFVTGGAFLFYVGTCFLLIGSVAWNAKRLTLNPWLAVGFPFTMVLLLYIAWKASLRTLWRGGIEWRGTFYSLRELKGASFRRKPESSSQFKNRP